MLTILAPTYCKNEIQYIIDVIFNTFWSLDYQLVYHSCSEFVISNDDNKSLCFPDVFFQKAFSNWLKPKSMPVLPLNNLDTRQLAIKIEAINPILPVLFGCETFAHENTKIYLPIDVFGSSFFMLSRYEEVVIEDKDKYGRFPYEKSLACQASFIERPLINEYIELLPEKLKKE